MGLIDNNLVFIAREDREIWKCSKMESDSKMGFWYFVFCNPALFNILNYS